MATQAKPRPVKYLPTHTQELIKNIGQQELLERLYNFVIASIGGEARLKLLHEYFEHRDSLSTLAARYKLSKTATQARIKRATAILRAAGILPDAWEEIEDSTQGRTPHSVLK